MPKKALYVMLAATLAMYACSNDKSISHENTLFDTSRSGKAPVATIPAEEDRIDTAVGPLAYLRCHSVEDTVIVTYRLRSQTQAREVRFMHPRFSEIVFPNLAVAAIGDTGFVEQQFAVLGDSLLVLPLIGISSRLHVYVIDLAEGSVDPADIRTWFSYVWLNPENASFVKSNMPFYNDDNTISWHLCLYQIRRSGNYLLKEKDLTEVVTEDKQRLDTDEMIPQQYEVVRKMLR